MQNYTLKADKSLYKGNINKGVNIGYMNEHMILSDTNMHTLIICDDRYRIDNCVKSVFINAVERYKKRELLVITNIKSLDSKRTKYMDDIDTVLNFLNKYIDEVTQKLLKKRVKSISDVKNHKRLLVCISNLDQLSNSTERLDKLIKVFKYSRTVGIHLVTSIDEVYEDKDILNNFNTKILIESSAKVVLRFAKTSVYSKLLKGEKKIYIIRENLTTRGSYLNEKKVTDCTLNECIKRVNRLQEVGKCS